MKRFYLASALAIVALLITSSSRAVTINVDDFENPASQGDGGFTSVPPTGFSGAVGGIVGIFNPQDNFFTGTTGDSAPLPAPAGGNQVAFFFATGSDGPSSITTMTSLLNQVIAPDTTYTLSVAVGQAVATLGRPFAGYDIALMSGATVLASSTNLVTPAPDSFSTVNTSFTTGLTDASIGSQLSIRLSSTASGPGGAGITETFMDNVQLTITPVPEPSSIALAGLAAAGLAIFVRRRSG